MNCKMCLHYFDEIEGYIYPNWSAISYILDKNDNIYKNKAQEIS